ncbi:MAG: sugar phosphate isomerase/epimerase [Clostridia bacterium]|nr:sugar phosphate isomerase/epimerase [Clostridia bacterium]
MNKKVSFSTGPLQVIYGDEQAIKIAKEIGADAIDFSTLRMDYRNTDCIFSKSEDEVATYFAGLKKLADDIGIEFAQTHGRIEGFRNDEAQDKALIKNAQLDCLAASVLAAPVCVIHSPSPVWLGNIDTEPAVMHKLNFEMFSSIIPFAKKYKIKLAMETFGDATGFNCCDFFGIIKEFIIGYNRLCSIDDNAEYMTTCVDTGHSNKAVRYGQPSAADVIRMLGHSVSTLHLNDNDGVFDQHKIPMTGTIDWNDVFDALDEVGYNGVYNMELELNHFGKGFEVETAQFAVKIMKNMLSDRYA